MSRRGRAPTPSPVDLDELAGAEDVAFWSGLERHTLAQLRGAGNASPLIGKLVEIRERRKEAEATSRGALDRQSTPRDLARSLLDPERCTAWASLLGWSLGDRERLSALVIECNARAKSRETADGASWPSEPEAATVTPGGADWAEAE